MMELLKHTAKIREYCDYLDEHVGNVEKAWKVLQEKCKDMRFIYDDYVWASIDSETEWHDISKVSPEEFIQYQRRFFPVDEPYKEGFKSAWKHHQENNPHHWENWAFKDYYNPYEAEVHCVGMVIDWMAMGYKFGDTAESYYLKNADTIKIPEWAVTFIKQIFDRIREEDPK